MVSSVTLLALTVAVNLTILCYAKETTYSSDQQDEHYDTANMEIIPDELVDFIDDLPPDIHIKWPTRANPLISIKENETLIFQGTLQELKRLMLLYMTNASY